MKKKIKTLLFGAKARDIQLKFGLLKNLNFNINPMHKSQRILGLDEVEIMHIIKITAQKVVNAIDIGANDGWYTTFFASLRNITKVIACEPDNNLHQSFWHNLDINENLKKKVILINKFIGTQSNDDYISLDKLKNELEPGKTLIKIDVDGAELDVLESGKDLLISDATYLIIETHSEQLEIDCINFLNTLGYKCNIIKNGWYRILVPELRPIEHNRWLYAEKS
jgi:hypothetical protein